MKRAALILLALSFLTASSAWADEATQKRASVFVQKFYDWYLPVSQKLGDYQVMTTIIKTRGAAFDPPLLRALKEDAEAQAAVPDDIVGLDFDPFLNSQDPDDKYVVGKVTESAGLYLVDVHGVRKGKREAKPNVVVELKPAKDSFIFTNFRYGTDGDLVAVLKSLADDRAHPAQ